MRYADSVILEQASAPPFFKNGFVIGCEETREGVMIDPGDEVDDLLAAVARQRLSITQILLTHAHLDHVTGVARAKRALGVPVWLHRADNFLYEGVVEQGRLFGFEVERQPPIDRFYVMAGHEGGEGHEGALRFGRYGIRVLHTPGHCPGGVCLAVGERPILFVGDTLFAGSIGRTDLPGGDMNTLLASIRNVLFAFPDDTVVWPGHGPKTTIGQERRTNPFLAHL
jgi:glyoxylase-like metal-dependent hydrolase (beta-lactamase superfamily II)